MIDTEHIFCFLMKVKSKLFLFSVENQMNYVASGEKNLGYYFIKI